MAMADITGLAREGLVAMSAAARTAAIFAAEITQAGGPKGKHNRDQAAVARDRRSDVEILERLEADRAEAPT
jgi:hypothetical protein